MWIITKTGFLSIVQNENAHARQDDLLVRARVREDLEDFVAFVGHDGVIESTPDADYPFRTYASREKVGAYVFHAVVQIGYPNFKDKIAETDVYRAHVYARVWGVLRGLHLVKRLAWHKAGVAEAEAHP